MNSLDLQPTLTGNLLILRPLDINDFESLYLAASDPLIWAQVPLSNAYQREIFIEVFNGAIASKSALAVINKEINKIIGTTRFYELNMEKSSVAIGYTFLTRACWGHTFNKEMKYLLINHAFSCVSTVIFHIGENNIRSQKAIQKIGARMVDKAERQFGNGPKTMYLTYQIEKHEYKI